jgi:hypothetical protein
MALWIAGGGLVLLVVMWLWQSRPLRKRVSDLERGGWLDSHRHGGYYPGAFSDTSGWSGDAGGAGDGGGSGDAGSGDFASGDFGGGDFGGGGDSGGGGDGGGGGGGDC